MKYLLSVIALFVSSGWAMADTALFSALPKYQCHLIHVSGKDEVTDVFHAESAAAATVQYVTQYLIPADVGYVLAEQEGNFNPADPKQEAMVIVDVLCDQVQ